MKTYQFPNKFWILSICIALFCSCSEDKMDEINENKNNPPDVESKFMLTEMMASSAFNITGADYCFYAASYMELAVGIYGQLYNAEIRVTEPIASSTYNNSWENSYTNIWHLKMVIEKCTTGAEAGNYLTLGIAQVLQAYNLAMITDLMGDTPWTEAGAPGDIFQPKIDKQEDIYKDVFSLLDQAIENLAKKSDYANLAKQDLIYGGDAKKWTKAAWALKARYTMRLSFRNPQYQNVIDYAEKAFASSAEQFQFNYNGSTAINPYYKFFIDRDYFGASQSLHDKLVERDDPRDDIFFEIHPAAESFLFAPNGRPEQVKEKYAVSALSSPTAPTYLMSYHELEFLKAEAYARLGQPDKAKQALQKAIVAAFEKVGLSASEAGAYYTSLQNRLNLNLEQEIMIQKYLAAYESECIEAYNDYRRLKAEGKNYVILTNTAAFPLRYTYGNSDVTTNLAIEAAYGDGSYVYSENVWWAGGSR